MEGFQYQVGILISEAVGILFPKIYNPFLAGRGGVGIEGNWFGSDFFMFDSC